MLVVRVMMFTEHGHDTVVCPTQACNSKTKKNVEKNKIGIDIPQGTSKWSANFQMKGQRSRSQDERTTQNWRHVYSWVTNQA